MRIRKQQEDISAALNTRAIHAEPRGRMLTTVTLRSWPTSSFQSIVCPRPSLNSALPSGENIEMASNASTPLEKPKYHDVRPSYDCCERVEAEDAGLQYSGHQRSGMRWGRVGFSCDGSTQKNFSQDNSVIMKFIVRRKNECNPTSLGESA